MQVYIVNELCELEQENYINCHGAFTNRERAYRKAVEVFNQAKEDVGEEWCFSDLKVWNDNNIITVDITSVELDTNE